MTDFHLLTEEERTQIKAARLNLLTAAAALDALLHYGPACPTALNLIRAHCDMNGEFCPNRSLHVIGFISRARDGRCPDCDGTADVCECDAE